MKPNGHDLRALAAGLGGIVVLTWAYVGWLHVGDAMTAALSFLIILLFVAASSPLWVAIATTVAAALALDFFFIPPAGTLNIDDPEDWIAFSSFVLASLVASRLSSLARRRQQEAMSRRDELSRLFDLSRDVLLITDGSNGLRSLAGVIRARFRFEHVAIGLHRDAAFERYEAGSPDSQRALQTADLPMQDGSRMGGSMTVAGGSIDPRTLDALASLVAIAIERIRLLDERRQAELAQRSIELKSMLLASIAHDLHTPLTAIQLAVNNLSAPELTDVQRSGQADVALRAADRLARLFRNILEMTRIDSGNLAPEPRWVSPEELVEAARSQVVYALNAHPIDVVDRSEGQAVHVDARLTSAALAHVLENAAHYSPPGSHIVVTHQVTSAGLRISVRDHGAGIAPEDIPHLFERFYRGGEARRHASGTGMGLAIARGLLASEGGRISADNCPAGGAEFSIVVPARRRAVDQEGDDNPSTDMVGAR